MEYNGKQEVHGPIIPHTQDVLNTLECLVLIRHPRCGTTAVSDLEAYVVSSQKVNEGKVTTLTANGKCVKIRSVIIRIVEYPLDQGSAHFLYEGSESKYFRFHRPYSLCCNYSVMP